MGSFVFNNVDMESYGLSVLKVPVPSQQSASAVQLARVSYADDSIVPPMVLSLNVAVQGATQATVLGYLDSIKRYLNYQTDKVLTLDFYTDRYWNARFQSMQGEFKSPLVWMGTIEFVCYDPYAYANSETSTDFTITTSPQTITATPGGSALIEPVFTLTASGTHTSVTIKINNSTLSQELVWTGTIPNGHELKIDSAFWIVYLQTVASMSTVTGIFPLLTPGSNSIIVTGFTGNLNITYRNRF
jgi:predicted phage tail component-like protein